MNNSCQQFVFKIEQVVCMVLLTVACFVAPAKADWVADTINYTTAYEAAGCSGIHSGMICRERNTSAPLSTEQREIRARLASERENTEGFTAETLRAIEDLVLNAPELLSEFHGAPVHVSSQDAAVSLACMRASIGSLFLLQEHPGVFSGLAMRRHTIPDGSARSVEEMDIRGRGHARRHAVNLYSHAALILGGRGDMLDPLFISEMNDLVLSQLTPALIQLEYLSTNYDLWRNANTTVLNLDVVETMLSVGFRIGFFNELIDTSDYPFTDFSCYVSQPRLSHLEEVSAWIDNLEDLRGFQLEDLLPNSMHEEILREPTEGSMEWLLANDHGLGTNVDWLGARVYPIAEVVGRVPSAPSGGVVVLSVVEGSLAARYGIQPGNIIWNMQPVRSADQLPGKGVVIDTPEDMIEAVNQRYTVYGFRFPMRMVGNTATTMVELEFN